MPIPNEEIGRSRPKDRIVSGAASPMRFGHDPASDGGLKTRRISEQKIQRTVVQHLRQRGVPRLVFLHVPNGGYGYIASMIDPKDRRRRVHRVLYNEQDRTWDQNSWVRSQANSRSTGQVSEKDRWENQGRSLVKAGEIVGENGDENDPKSLKPFLEGDRTYVEQKEHIRKRELVDATDCAEARLAMKVSEVQAYLADLEALVASEQRDEIRFERAALARLANDACLPETLNERAARLLSQIGLP
ncbi:hypothetical protein J4G48_0007095 [Bradyrhizobium barranii subsp. apii]|uniref:hypothetical protein n=1 Tax=Bradyrhizobium barranii TaxID=2992140 RepID=UPI001AA17DE5|nr:hypothetical protein [Bradyrhizobium barranii]UPT97839.1 hypothetical protein J4G48_0007095 [Bradyrhizobium barranii subsp. apii]